mmetsp:Transcript_14454/g.23438  ORF Transcript_14454/g.23438 Transcript_14454/m.23438 type:complete len:95 (-) Transcript_14454:872-1156(-)
MFAVSSGKALSNFYGSRIAFSGARRMFAEDSTKPAVVKPRGGGLLSRISSFFVGAGLTALVTQFYIFQELRDGNKAIITKQKEMETRLSKLEGK